MARIASSVTWMSSWPPGSSKAEYWPRLPIVVTPAVSAAREFAKPAGVPIMKSPRCGWMAAASPSLCHSDGASSRARLLVERAALGLGHAHRPRQRQPEPVAGHAHLGQAALDLLEHSAVAAQSVEPIWMWYMTRSVSRARCLPRPRTTRRSGACRRSGGCAPARPARPARAARLRASSRTGCDGSRDPPKVRTRLHTLLRRPVSRNDG